MTGSVLNKLKFLTETEKKALSCFEASVREALSENLLLLEVFGSRARGEGGPESDIDVLVLVRDLTPAVMEKVAAVASDISIGQDVLIAPVVLSEGEYEKNRHVNTLFVREIERDGVLLYGPA